MLPLLYLHGLSSGDFVPALGQFLGSSAGLSSSVITKLTETWKAEAAAFAQRDLAGTDYVYVWADGIHLNIRLDEEKLCLLVMIGVRIDGRKELIALAPGYRESSESWSDLMRDCVRRGMRAPVLAAGDGALGSWSALRDVFPETKEQRCWFHKIANVLGALPKSAHPARRSAGRDLMPRTRQGQSAAKKFAALFGAKFPKAAAKVTDDLDQLLAFYDFPAEPGFTCAPPTLSNLLSLRSCDQGHQRSRRPPGCHAYKLIDRPAPLRRQRTAPRRARPPPRSNAARAPEDQSPASNLTTATTELPAADPHHITTSRPGIAFGDQAVHPACCDCHIASHVCDSGALPRKRRCEISVVFAARFACPVHPFGAMPGRGQQRYGRQAGRRDVTAAVPDSP